MLVFCCLSRMCILSIYVSICRCYVFFFFKQKTAYDMRISDWSSDVCSSDLATEQRYRACHTGRTASPSRRKRQTHLRSDSQRLILERVPKFVQLPCTVPRCSAGPEGDELQRNARSTA